jgi:cell division septum initiation protein DivIVA
MPQHPLYPPLPRPIDEAIAKVHGSSVALDATPERLAAAKHQPTPSLKEIIESRTRENSDLREEIKYLLREKELADWLAGEFDYVRERAERVLKDYHKAVQDLDREREVSRIDNEKLRREATSGSLEPMSLGGHLMSATSHVNMHPIRRVQCQEATDRFHSD